MRYQSQELSQFLLAPLNAVFQDVRKHLQMELDIERIEQTDELTEQPVPLSAIERSLTLETTLATQFNGITERANSTMEVTPSSTALDPSNEQYESTTITPPSSATTNLPLSPNSTITTIQSVNSSLTEHPALLSTVNTSLPCNESRSTETIEQTYQNQTLETAPVNNTSATSASLLKPQQVKHSSDSFAIDNESAHSPRTTTPLKFVPLNNRDAHLMTASPLKDWQSFNLTDVSPRTESNPSASHGNVPSLTTIANEVPSTLSNNSTVSPSSSASILPLMPMDNTSTMTTDSETWQSASVQPLIPSNSSNATPTPERVTLNNEKPTLTPTISNNSIVPTSASATNPAALISTPPVVTNQSTLSAQFTAIPKASAPTPEIATPQASVLIPLRNEPASKATTTTATTSQRLPSATANRLEAAVEPALQQAYQLTQQQLQSMTEDTGEQQTGLVNNTFNVSVAMNNNTGSNVIDLSDFEQALTDVLRTAARRQGLEV